MNTFKAKLSDPLLLSASVLLWIAFGALVIGGIAAISGSAAVWFYEADVLSEIAKETGKAASPDAISAISALLLSVSAACGLGSFFVWLWLKVIASVGEGNPFTTGNADRLERMGWISLVLFALGFLIAGIVDWAGQLLPGMDGEANIDLGGIILVLMLFILARLFRLGAAMREDLEGTV
jgi:hypothetical protein